MLFSSKLYYVPVGLKNDKILTVNLSREFDKFLLVLELYKINNITEEIVNLIIEHCKKNPERNSLLKKIDCSLVDNYKLDYYEVEEYLNTLEKRIEKINSKISSDDEIFRFSIFDNFIINIDKKSVYRLYNDFKSFYSNYLILDSIYKMIFIKNPAENINEKIGLKDVININTNINNEDNNSPNNSIENSSKDVSSTDKKYDRVISEDNLVLFYHLYNLCVDYYSNIPINLISLDSNVLKIPPIFNRFFEYNSKIISESIYSILQINKNSINDILNMIRKLSFDILSFSLEENNKIAPIYIMGRIFLLYMYCLTFVYLKNEEYFENKYELLVNNTEQQEKLINLIYSKMLKDVPLNIEISTHSYSEIIENFINDQIEEKIKFDCENIFGYVKNFNSEEEFYQTVFKHITSQYDTNTIFSEGFYFNDLKDNKIKETIKCADLFFNNTIEYSSEDNQKSLYSLFKEFCADRKSFILKNISSNSAEEFNNKKYINSFNIIFDIINSKEFIDLTQTNSNIISDYYDIFYNKFKSIFPPHELSSIYDSIYFRDIIFKIIVPYLNETKNIKIFQTHI